MFAFLTALQQQICIFHDISRPSSNFPSDTHCDWMYTYSSFPSHLQLDSEDAEPNFDEDGRDEYNELHMPVWAGC